MNRVLVLIGWCLPLLASAQAGSKDSGEDVFDVLNTTTTPAFMVMGVSNTEIARPTSFKDFTASLQNTTKGFTELPNTYGIEIRPIREKDVTSEEACNVMKYFSISFGYHLENVGEANEMTKVGLGINIPIIRPRKVGNKERLNNSKAQFNTMILTKEATQDNVRFIQANMVRIAGSRGIIGPGKDFSTMTEEEKLMIVQQTRSLEALQQETFSLEAVQKLIRKEKGSEKVRREGFFMNFYGGITWNYPQSFSADSALSRWGGWITTGLERGFGKPQSGGSGEKPGFISISGVFKLLDEPFMRYFDANNVLAYQQSTAIEAGLKGALTLFNGNFDFSFEVLTRQRLEENAALKKTSKWVFNAAYAFPKDCKMSISFGKDFENILSKNGNIISFINLIKSVGKNGRNEIR